MPDAAPSVNRLRRGSSRSNDSLRFRHRPYAFDTSSVVPLRSSSCQSPDLVLPRPFPSVLTTMAFDHSRRRWFGTCSCQPVPRGLPSSIKQLHTLGPPRPFALVAHNRPRNGPPSRGPSPLSPTRLRASRTRNAGKCSPAAVKHRPLRSPHPLPRRSCCRRPFQQPQTQHHAHPHPPPLNKGLRTCQSSHHETARTHISAGEPPVTHITD